MLSFFSLSQLATSLVKGLWTLLSDPKIWMAGLIIVALWLYSGKKEAEAELSATVIELESTAALLERAKKANAKAQVKVIYRDRYIIKSLGELTEAQKKDDEAKDWLHSPVPPSVRDRLRGVWESKQPDPSRSPGRVSGPQLRTSVGTTEGRSRS